MDHGSLPSNRTKHDLIGVARVGGVREFKPGRRKRSEAASGPSDPNLK